MIHKKTGMSKAASFTKQILKFKLLPTICLYILKI